MGSVEGRGEEHLGERLEDAPGGVVLEGARNETRQISLEHHLRVLGLWQEGREVEKAGWQWEEDSMRVFCRVLESTRKDDRWGKRRPKLPVNHDTLRLTCVSASRFSATR